VLTNLHNPETAVPLQKGGQITDPPPQMQELFSKISKTCPRGPQPLEIRAQEGNRSATDNPQNTA
jgi:hypothetical protein